MYQAMIEFLFLVETSVKYNSVAVIFLLKFLLKTNIEINLKWLFKQHEQYI